MTSAKEVVLNKFPWAQAHQDMKYKDWVIYKYGNTSTDVIGYGSQEDDAWRDAEARMKEMGCPRKQAPE